MELPARRRMPIATPVRVSGRENHRFRRLHRGHPDRARGQLASSTRTAMLLAPDILHVVAYTEADHATGPGELISSCELVHQVIDDSLRGLPDPASDPEVAARRDELIGEAEALLHMIERDAPEALLGETAAQMLRKGVGDSIELGGTTVTVRGIFESTSMVEAAAIVLPLPLMQSHLDNAGKINFLNLRLESGGLLHLEIRDLEH